MRKSIVSTLIERLLPDLARFVADFVPICKRCGTNYSCVLRRRTRKDNIEEIDSFCGLDCAIDSLQAGDLLRYRNIA